jgi:hypothetical protein
MRAVHWPVATLGHGYSVKFTFLDGAIRVDWLPCQPSGADREAVMSAYLASRNAFIAELASRLGAKVMVVGADGSSPAVIGKGAAR